MSDDTPTQRYDATGNDAPTQRFDQPTERFDSPAATAVPLEADEERKSRRLMIILGSVGGVLLVVLIVLLTRGNGTPSALPTPTTTPTPTVTPSVTPTPVPTVTQTVTPAPPPPSSDASVDDFTVSTTVADCSAGDPVITLTWTTSNASKVSFGVDTNDASTSPFFSDIVPSGTSDTDFPPGYSPFTYTCSAPTHTYVITAVNDANGTKDSVALVVTRG